MIPENGGNCPDGDCTTFDGGSLNEIVLTSSRSNSNGSNATWTSEVRQYDYALSPEQWKKDTGMSVSDYTPEMAVAHIDYWNETAAEERLRDFINRFKYIYDTGVLHYAEDYLKIATAARIIGASGKSSFFSRALQDAGLQYVITGDVDLIGAGAGGFSGRFGFFMRIVGANIDYSLGKNQFTSTLNETKSPTHMFYDFIGSSGPSLSRRIASPDNLLGANGVNVVGSSFGIFMSDKLKGN